MKKELLKVFLISFIMLNIISLSFAAKIHLKNGSIIGGEIISFDNTSVTIIEPVLGTMKVSKDKIINIGPLLANKAAKKRIIEPEIQKPKVQEPARKAVLPQFSKTKRAIQEPILPEFLSEQREKKRISLYLSGGISIINGGDLNGVIRDINQLVNDWNDPSLTDDWDDSLLTDYSADWKEIELIQNWKGEVIINLSPSFSFGLGVEYLDTKKKKGTITLNDAYSGTEDIGLDYYNYSKKYYDSFEPEQQLIVIPLTFNFYYFIPIFNIAEFFLKGGVSYNFARLKYNETYQDDHDKQEDYYASDATFWYTLIDNDLKNGTYSYEAKSKETGFQVGGGFDIKLFSFISLVVEGTYRYINFKDWTGDGSDDLSWDEQWGRSDLDYSTDSGNKSDALEGRIWYYEIYDSATDKEYGYMSLHEEEPWLEFIKNVRAAKINLNGYSLRAGIKINF